MDLSPFNYEHRRDVAVILGAGASRGADFVHPHTICKPPLDGDFFSVLRSSRLQTHLDARRLFAFLEQEFGTLDVRMESFYSQSTLYDQFSGEIPSGRGKRRAYEWGIRYFRRLLPLFFQEAFGDRRCNYHAALAAAASPRDSFISFNYDCLMDRALVQSAGRRWDPKKGYGFQVTSGLDHWQSPERARGRPFKTSIQLLKPHGSLNWRTTVRGTVALRRSEYEDRPEDELTIVAPLWQKSFDKFPYGDVWRRIRKVLASARALFVIGYSLPETDVYTQAALRMDVTRLHFLCVVNPDPEARARIFRLLRGATSESTYVVEFSTIKEVWATLGGSTSA